MGRESLYHLIVEAPICTLICKWCCLKQCNRLVGLWVLQQDHRFGWETVKQTNKILNSTFIWQSAYQTLKRTSERAGCYTYFCCKWIGRFRLLDKGTCFWQEIVLSSVFIHIIKIIKIFCKMSKVNHKYKKKGYFGDQ